MMTPGPMPSSHNLSSGGRLVRPDAATLPLREVTIRATARGGVARVVLEQRFHNAHSEPLTATYLFPLPADGAVSGYAFQIGERRIVGEIDRRAAARERFEEALAEGRTAALLDQERDALFTQEIGNIPPGTDVTVQLVIDQPLQWLREGSWEWRFPTASAPRYLGGPGQVVDAPRVAHDVADGPLAVRASLELTVGDALPEGRQPESPSHPTRATRRDETGGASVVRFAAEDGSALDRDVVVRWPVGSARVGLQVETMATPASSAAAGAYGLLTVVPPVPEANPPRVPRDLIVLLDTSGSMAGAPLDQARRITLALVDTLTPDDQLELIEFSTEARRWKRGPVAADPGQKAEARSWLGRLQAGGGTSMREGIYEAIAGLRAVSQRQVVLVTDGLIGFESEVVATIASRLPPSCRVHTVGVGSAVNRSLTRPVARVGRGLEVVISLDEDPERAAQRLLARTDTPLVVEVTASGSALLEHAPARLPDLFAGAPVLVSARLRPEGGELVVRGRTARGEWVERRLVAPAAVGGNEALPALFAREQVEDLEARIAGNESREALEAQIERVGLQFQIATRLTSWVAATTEPSVDPREPTRRVRVPQNLPHGVSVEGLGLRPLAGPPPMLRAAHGFAAGGAPPPAMASRMRAPTGIARAAAPPPAAARPGKGTDDARTRVASIAERPFFRPFERAEGDELTRGAPVPGQAQAEWLGRGRVMSRTGDLLLIEVTLEGATLPWEAGSTAEIVWTDGTRATALVLVEQSTRTTSVASGATIRVALKLAGPTATAPGEVTIALAQGRLVVRF
jgi:Ca-activated chloride channel family protein